MVTGALRRIFAKTTINQLKERTFDIKERVVDISNFGSNQEDILTKE
jgi:hypothetical protein